MNPKRHKRLINELQWELQNARALIQYQHNEISRLRKENAALKRGKYAQIDGLIDKLNETVHKEREMLRRYEKS